MSFDVLYYDSNDGVALGGLHDVEDIKVLICYLLSQTDRPVTAEFVCSVLQKCGTVNYFEASHSFAELISNGQLVPSSAGSNEYVLADSGRFIVNTLADELPVATKEISLKAYKNFLRQIDIKKENIVKLHSKDNKTYVECTVNDGDNPLLKIDMYMPNAEEAGLVRNVFYNNTDIVYQTIVALLTGDRRTALEVLYSSELNTDDVI